MGRLWFLEEHLIADNKTWLSSQVYEQISSAIATCMFDIFEDGLFLHFALDELRIFALYHEWARVVIIVHL